MKRVCRRKSWYVNEEVARGTARRMLLKRGVFLRAYECPHCSRWHLTSQIEGKKKRV